MSTSLSAHQGCVELFRQSDLGTDRPWSNPFGINRPLSNQNVFSDPKANKQHASRRPYLRVEMHNDDFAYLAKNHHLGTSTAIATAAKSILPEKAPATHKNNVSSVVASQKITMEAMRKHSTLESSGWVVLESKIMEDEWDFVQHDVRKELRPTYADIVMEKNGDGLFILVVHPEQPETQKMTHVHAQKWCPKTKPSRTERDTSRVLNTNMGYGIVSSSPEEDMWLCSKYDTAKAYHRKVETKRIRRKNKLAQ